MALVPEDTNWSQTSGPSLSSGSCEHEKEAEWEKGGEAQGLAPESRPEQVPFLSQMGGLFVMHTRYEKWPDWGGTQRYPRDV